MVQRIKWDSRIIQFLEIILDLSIVVASMLGVLYFNGDLSDLTIVNTVMFAIELVIANGILLMLTFIFFRVYKVSIVKNGYFAVIPRIAISLIMANIITAFISLFLSELSFSRSMFVYSLILQMSTFIVVKYLLYQFFKRVNIKSAMVIGPENQTDEFVKKLLLDSEKYIKLKYMIYENKDCKGQLEDILEYIEYVDQVYLTANLDEKKKNAIIQVCIEKDKTFFLVPKIYELAIKNANIHQISDVLAYEVSGLEMNLENKLLKRIFDLTVSIIGIVVTSPIMIIMAIIIKTYDGGPVFFEQERLTYKNKKFKVIKFRTMIPNAEKHTGPVLATEDDPRITKIGKFMRKTRIDELPQFINIFKGEMSIVGPRPEREHFVEQFQKENPTYMYRMNVKAGVTGLAQALGKYDTSYEDKLRFDLYYIRNYSIFLDIYILLHTIRAVVDEESAKGLSGEMNIKDILTAFHLQKFEEKPNCNIFRVVGK